MKKIQLLYLFPLLALTSCKTIVDYDYTTIQYVQNTLNQTVTLQIYELGNIREEATIAAGAEREFQYIAETTFPPTFMEADSVRMIFADGKSKVDALEDLDDEVNILDEGDHIVEEGDRFRYFIDQDDYDEAN